LPQRKDGWWPHYQNKSKIKAPFLYNEHPEQSLSGSFPGGHIPDTLLYHISLCFVKQKIDFLPKIIVIHP